MSNNTTFLSPYRDSYPSTVQLFQIEKVTPLDKVVYDDERVLVKNLKLGEFRKSSFVLNDERNLFHSIPIDTRLFKVFTILRNALGDKIKLTSSFRSQRWDLNKDRSGNGRHTWGQAFDLTGKGLLALVREALETENQLYKDLRKAGVNGFGLYESKNFVHIDLRPTQSDGDYVLFTDDNDDLKEIKKKGTSFALKTLGIIAGIVLTVAGLFKLKKR